MAVNRKTSITLNYLTFLYLKDMKNKLEQQFKKKFTWDQTINALCDLMNDGLAKLAEIIGEED